MLSCLQNSNECTAMHTRAYWILCIYHVEAWESGFMQLVSPLPFSCIKHSDHVTCKLIQRDKASKTTTPEDNAFFLKRKNELPQAGFDCTCVDRVDH